MPVFVLKRIVISLHTHHNNNTSNNKVSTNHSISDDKVSTNNTTMCQRVVTPQVERVSYWCINCT